MGETNDKKQKISIHGYVFSNRIKECYGFSPILDPVITLKHPIQLFYSIRVGISLLDKDIHNKKLDDGINSLGEKGSKLINLKSFTNDPITYQVSCYDKIKELYDYIYSTSEYKEISIGDIITYNTPPFLYTNILVQRIKDKIDNELIKKSNKNYRESMNICMVGENMYVYFYMICNKSKNYIEYENNTFIGEYNGINFYLDKFIDKNSIFMTYISKS